MGTRTMMGILVIPIGARMGLSGDDAELDLTLSGFPADAQQLWFTDWWVFFRM